MDTLLTLAIAFYSIDAVLFAFLAYVYGRTAISTKARYPWGLFIFSVLLLVQTAGTAAAYLSLGEYFGQGAYPAMSVMAGFEFVGVLALLRITL